MDFFVLMDSLKNVGSCRSVCEFELVETFLIYLQFVAFFEVFDGHLTENGSDFVVTVFV